MMDVMATILFIKNLLACYLRKNIKYSVVVMKKYYVVSKVKVVLAASVFC